MLWRYVIALKSKSGENTMKIEVERPFLTITPYFGILYFFQMVVRRVSLRNVCHLLGVDGCYLNTKYNGKILMVLLGIQIIIIIL